MSDLRHIFEPELRAALEWFDDNPIDSPHFDCAAFALRQLLEDRTVAARRWDGLISDENIEAAAEGAFTGTMTEVWGKGDEIRWEDAEDWKRDAWRITARAALTAVKSLSGKDTL